MRSARSSSSVPNPHFEAALEKTKDFTLLMHRTDPKSPLAAVEDSGESFFSLAFDRRALLRESPFFATLIVRSPGCTSYLIPWDAAYEVDALRAFYAWLYGRAAAPRHLRCDLFILANFLDVPRLCGELQAAFLLELSPETCAELLTFSEAHADLNAALVEHVSGSVDKFLLPVANGSLEGLSKDALLKIMSCPVLSVSSEFNLWQIIKQWLQDNALSLEPAACRELLGAVLPHLRLGLLPLEQFVELCREYTELTLDSSNELLSRTFDFILDNEAAGGKLCSTCPQTRPRDPSHCAIVLGGWTGGEPTDKIDLYDIYNDVWYTLSLTLPFPRSYSGCGLLREMESVYIIGGYNHNERFSSVFELNLRTLKWAERSCLHVPRCFIGSAVCDGHIYAFGGHSGKTSSRERVCEKFSLQDNQWSLVCPLNQDRSDCGSAVWEKNIFAVGGFSGAHYLRSVESYNTVTDEWRELPPLDTARGGVGCAILNGILYAIGGYDGDERLSSVEALDLSRRQEGWKRAPSLTLRRSNMGVFVANNRIYVTGGFSDPNTNSVCEYFDGTCWKMAAQMLRSTSGLSCAQIPPPMVKAIVNSRTMLSSQFKRNPKLYAGKKRLSIKVIRDLKKKRNLSTKVMMACQRLALA